MKWIVDAWKRQDKNVLMEIFIAGMFSLILAMMFVHIAHTKRCINDKSVLMYQCGAKGAIPQ